MKGDRTCVKAVCTIRRGEVVANVPLCQEHFRLTMTIPGHPVARAGQFVHLSPQRATHQANGSERASRLHRPMLRRAFSIAAFRQFRRGPEVDVIYRVVGVATRWMESLRAGDAVSVLGPQGNVFPIEPNRQHAWLVAGGVGLPPMLFLAEALREAGKSTVAFCGAQSCDLLALSMDTRVPPSSTAHEANACAVEFTERAARAVISTDDGTMGFRGHVGEALAAYYEANPTDAGDVVVYTCGPERMMEFVARFCQSRRIRCYVCMERAMACGTGMCQSCVVPVRDPSDAGGWRYKLCCTDGPVFDAVDVLFAHPAG